jgi:hypothetical protein
MIDSPSLIAPEATTTRATKKAGDINAPAF